MRKAIAAFSFAATALTFPAHARDTPPVPDQRDCARVLVTRATVDDLEALQADADCFADLEAGWDAVADHSRERQASARGSKRYRENRIAEIKRAIPPTPPAPPPSKPTPAPGYVVSPTLEGAERFHTPFDIKLGLTKAGIPGEYSDTKGAFRFVCGGNGALRRDDPVVYPGQPGKSHLHQPWGNADFTADTTPDSLRQSAATDCNDTRYSLNRSLYWQPALVNDKGEAIQPDLVVVYYKQWASDTGPCTPGAPNFIGKCVGLPNKIRFIFGWDMFDPTAPVKGAVWSCGGNKAKNLADLFAKGCKEGDTLEANTMGQNCWDGKYLDTPDHRSHVAYAGYDNRGRYYCPASHPFTIPQEENKAQWRVTADMIAADGSPRIRLSSDHMLPGGKPGATLHADYMEGWVWEAKQMWQGNCIEKRLSCSSGGLGNGFKLIGAEKPSYGWQNPKARVTLQPTPHH